MIDGAEPQAVAIGQSLAGVKVVSVQGDQVVVEIGGKKRPLRVGQHAIGTAAADGSGRIVMTADNQGHFVTTGSVNGVAVRFLVDTGATMISLGASDARRVGVDFNRGDVTLHNVGAVIHQTEMPVALLGMSFLNRMEMQRDGSTMTLKRRF